MERLTPLGVSGVAIVRVAAAEREALLGMLRAPDGGAFVLRGQVPQRATLRVDGRDLDDALVVDRGERGLELHLHGAPAVLAALHRRFPEPKAPSPPPAARLLRSALSKEQLDLALEQLEHDFASRCGEIARLPPAARATGLSAALLRSRVAMAMVQPQRVVWIGRQNAGKSSLFNRLLCRERALTGPTPGLTRDPVAERTTLAGYPYELVDTAGEGATPAAVDAAALQRGRALRQRALRVLVVDASCGPCAADLELWPRCDLVVANKIDLPRAPWPATVPCHAAVSAQAGHVADLRATFGELLRRARGLPAAGPVGGFAALSAAQWALLRRLAGRAHRRS